MSTLFFSIIYDLVTTGNQRTLVSSLDLLVDTGIKTIEQAGEGDAQMVKMAGPLEDVLKR